MSAERPAMYHEQAEWFHLLTSPDDYREEATFYFDAARKVLGRPPTNWLELGSGGGNNASHYKAWVEGPVVLSDRSPEMLAISQRLNPEIEHVLADMLDVRLGRSFDVVFVHDAAAYLTGEEQVRKLAETLYIHCNTGGAALVCPDNFAENLTYETDHGGHDGDGRAMRYLEWVIPGPPGTYEYYVDYAYLYHEDGKPPHVVHDRHTCGALPRTMWLDAMTDAGFKDVHTTPLVHSEVPEGTYEVILARK